MGIRVSWLACLQCPNVVQYIYFAVRVAIIHALVTVFFVFVLLVDFRVFFTPWFSFSTGGVRMLLSLVTYVY